jgi:hypothetical protein
MKEIKKKQGVSMKETHGVQRAKLFPKDGNDPGSNPAKKPKCMRIENQPQNLDICKSLAILTKHTLLSEGLKSLRETGDQL